jgi:hypothetical protein
LLVLRGPARRAAAAIGAAAAFGVAAVVAASGDDARAAALQAQSTALAGPAEGASLTAWFLVAAGAAAVCAGCLVVAVVTAGRWPEMSRRYDAPAARGTGTTTSQDAWRALDEGRDPTA